MKNEFANRYARYAARFTMLLTAWLFLASANAVAEEQMPEEATAFAANYSHEGRVYPPMYFVSNVEGDDFKETLLDYQTFDGLDDESVGLPIALKVYNGHRTREDGKTVTSLLASSLTLGLIPVASRTEFKVRYDVIVQGKSIEHFEYTMNTTDVRSFYSMGEDFETKPSETMFLAATIPQFLTELAESEEVQSIFDEYWEYFSD